MRSLGESRFRSSRSIGEDVNPSAYIVNLADCMLVLALGFLVALITAWNITLGPSVEEFDGNQLEQVNPETMPQDVAEGGDYYISVGEAFTDPKTGKVYILKRDDVDVKDEGSDKAKSGKSEKSDDSGNDSGKSNNSNDSGKSGASGGTDQTTEGTA